MSPQSTADYQFSKLCSLYLGDFELEDFRQEPVKFSDKLRAVNVVYTNCNTKSKREVLIKELMAHYTVHSSGSCLHNYDDPLADRPSKGFWRKKEIYASRVESSKKYMFTLSMENAISQDYHDEKIFQCFLAGSIPIYAGATNIADYVPTGSYILATDFKNGKELADYLQRVSEDEELYNSYMAWKKKPFEEKFVDRYRHSLDFVYDFMCETIAANEGVTCRSD